MLECNYFWKAVYITTNGWITPCCYFENPFRILYRDSDGKLIKNYDIPEHEDSNKIHNHYNLVNIREQVLNNETPKGCMKCIETEQHGIQSHRQGGLSDYDRFDVHYNSIPEKEKTSNIEIENIRHIDLRIGNTCNYMCVMCGSNESHLIAKENKKQNKLFNLPSPTVGWGDQTDNILSFLDNAINVKTVTIGGGEPFYNIKLLTKILQALLSRSKKVTVTMITNGSTVNENIFKLLNQFNKVKMNLSLDGTDRYIETQRWNSNWEKIKSNIAIMEQVFKPTVLLRVIPLITALTITNLTKLLQWVEDTNAIHDCDPEFVIDPVYMQCSLVKRSVLDKVMKDVSAMNLTKTSKKRICTYLKNTKQTPELRYEFDEYFSDLKKLRGLDVYKAIPELKDTLLTMSETVLV